ncbi:hypothetical protein [Corynebacterium flavescens]|uniref:hypothetical protein n=1 Tax=Corynebacterium flavescens TaxID=28028 RepID=UPI003FD41C06
MHNLPTFDLEGEHGGWNVAGFTSLPTGYTAIFTDGTRRPVIGLLAVEHVHNAPGYPEAWADADALAGTGRLRYVPAILSDNFVAQPAQSYGELLEVTRD